MPTWTSVTCSVDASAARHVADPVVPGEGACAPPRVLRRYILLEQFCQNSPARVTSTPRTKRHARQFRLRLLPVVRNRPFPPVPLVPRSHQTLATNTGTSAPFCFHVSVPTASPSPVACPAWGKYGSGAGPSHLAEAAGWNGLLFTRWPRAP